MNQTENEPKVEEHKDAEPMLVVTEPKVMKFSIPNKEKPKSEENLVEHAFGLDQNDSHEGNQSMKIELDPVEAEKQIAVTASPYKRLSIKDELKAEPATDQNVTNNATSTLEIQIEAKEEKEGAKTLVEEVKQDINSVEKSPQKEDKDIEMEVAKEEDNAIEVKDSPIKEKDNIEIAVSSQSSKKKEESSKKSNHIQVINLSKSKSKEKVLSAKKENTTEPIIPPHIININELNTEASTFIDDFTLFLKQENLCIRNDELYELDSPSQSLYENALFWKFLTIYLSRRSKETKDIQLSMLYLIRLTNRAISYIKGDDDDITSFKEVVCDIIRDNFKPDDFFFMLSLKNVKDSDAEKENKITLPLLEHLLSKPEVSINSKRKKSSAVKPLISNIELCINKENELSFEHCKKIQFSKRKVLMESNDSFCMNGVMVMKKDEGTEKEEEEKEEIIDTCKPSRKTKNKKEAKNSVTSIKSDEEEESDEEEMKGKIKRRGKSKLRKTTSTKSRNKSNRKTKKH